MTSKKHIWKITSTDYPVSYTCQDCGAVRRCYARHDFYTDAGGKTIRSNSACHVIRNEKTELADLTNEERRAIASLKRLAKRWPSSLWLFSASGILHVMRKGDDGRRVTKSAGAYWGAHGESVDQEYSVDTIDIENDGGDW